MTASIPGTDRVPDRVIVERIKPYLPDVPDELLLGLVKGAHVIVPRGPWKMNEVLVRAVARSICEADDGGNVDMIFAETEHHGDCALAARPDTYTCAKCQAENYAEIAQAALTAIEQVGYAVVPREPTEAMLKVGRELIGETFAPAEFVNEQVTGLYKALLAAERDDG